MAPLTTDTRLLGLPVIERAKAKKLAKRLSAIIFFINVILRLRTRLRLEAISNSRANELR